VQEERVDRSHFKQIRIVQLQGADGVIRVEETYRQRAQDPSPTLLSRFAMSADHVMVQLKPGANERSVSQFLKDHGGRIDEALSDSSVLIVSFNASGPAALDRFLTALQSDPEIAHARPDYLVWPTR
jgi:hypothetical protein